MDRSFGPAGQGNVQQSFAISVQMFNRAVIPTMWAKLHSGQTIKQALDWASHELEGFVR